MFLCGKGLYSFDNLPNVIVAHSPCFHSSSTIFILIIQTHPAFQPAITTPQIEPPHTYRSIERIACGEGLLDRLDHVRGEGLSGQALIGSGLLFAQCGGAVHLKDKYRE